MANTPPSLVVQRLRGLMTPPAVAEASDGQLLDRFAAGRDEDAFAALVRRHGRMVLGVCRRVLGHEHDAEDVFQATFCVLARKPQAVKKRDSVGAWLHGVAYRLAVEARRGRARRQAHERQAALPSRQPRGEQACRELEEVLDQVLLLVPPKYCQAFVLCYLEGKTQEEAARQLGCPLGTVRSRLARGRLLVQEGLRARGLTLSAAALGTVLVGGAGAAALPPALLRSAAQTALEFAAGQPIHLAAHVRDLAERALHSLVAARLKRVLAVALLLGAVVAGVGLAALHTDPPQGANPAQPALPPPPRQQPLQADRQGDALPVGALAQLGSAGFRHEGAARSLTFSPDGEIVAAMSWGDVVVWQTRTGKELYRLPAFGAWSGRALFAFSGDGKLLATRQDRTTIALSETATGKPLRTLVLPEIPDHDQGVPDLENPHALRFSPDGKWLALALPRHFLVLDAATGKAVQQNAEHVPSFTFLPDKQALLVEVDVNRKVPDKVAKPREIQVREIATGKMLSRLEVRGPARPMDAVSPDGKTIATASLCVVVLWDAATGETARTLSGATGAIMGLAFVPDGTAVIAASETGKVHVWDVATGKLLHQWAAQAPTLGAAAFSADGKKVAALVHNTVGLWDAATGKALFEHHGHRGRVNAVAYSPDGKLLVSAGDDQLLMWDTATRLPVRHDRGAGTGSVAFAPDGALLALLPFPNGFLGGTIRCLEVATAKETLRITPETDRREVRAVAFTPDGKTLVSVDGEVTADDANVTRVSRWDRATGKRLHQFTFNGFFPTCLAVSPDGTKVAVGGLSPRGTIRLCDLATGKQLWAVGGAVVHNLAFSPDGKRLVSGHYDQSLRLWDVAAGKHVFAAGDQGGDGVTVAFSPDGRLIASASQPMELARLPRPHQHVIRVWEVSTGKERQRLQGHQSLVFSLAFSPDGSRLASGLRNGTVLEWDLTGRHAPPRD
jgi:RNA polymerase sigma factor (sigma-70 family)